MTYRFWWFPTPLDSICNLTSDHGWQGQLQSGIHPSGRPGQYVDVPAEIADGWGGNIITSHKGKITLNLRGFLGNTDGFARIQVDDVTLPDSSGPIPPPPSKDMIDISKVTVYNAPQDVASWPITVGITEVTVKPSEGWAFAFDKVLPDSWKWPSNPNDPSDNYQYTVWPVVKVGGIWYMAGIVQMWQGRPSTGPFEMPTWNQDFHKNWCYDSRWGMMFNYFPNPGDEFGFFVSAGNGRGTDGVTSVRERSNVVKFQLPLNDTGSFNF